MANITVSNSGLLMAARLPDTLSRECRDLLRVAQRLHVYQEYLKYTIDSIREVQHRLREAHEYVHDLKKHFPGPYPLATREAAKRDFAAAMDSSSRLEMELNEMTATAVDNISDAPMTLPGLTADTASGNAVFLDDKLKMRLVSNNIDLTFAPEVRAFVSRLWNVHVEFKNEIKLLARAPRNSW